eukprot:1055239-Rhodomonas_salina.2
MACDNVGPSSAYERMENLCPRRNPSAGMRNPMLEAIKMVDSSPGAIFRVADKARMDSDCVHSAWLQAALLVKKRARDPSGRVKSGMDKRIRSFSCTMLLTLKPMVKDVTAPAIGVPKTRLVSSSVPTDMISVNVVGSTGPAVALVEIIRPLVSVPIPSGGRVIGVCRILTYTFMFRLMVVIAIMTIVLVSRVHIAVVNTPVGIDMTLKTTGAPSSVPNRSKCTRTASPGKITI